MRLITKQSIDAFLANKPFKKANMEVWVGYECSPIRVTKLMLHGNTIAQLDKYGKLMITNAGYFSNTTKERLNGLPNVSIQQKNFQWYLNGEKWDGDWQYIGTVN